MSVVPITYTTNMAAQPSTWQRTGNQWIDLVGPAADLAKLIASTEFVPDAMRNKPAAITAAILYGAEIGIGPLQALSKIDIVKGRPAPRAELARALALAAGHEVWVDESTNTRVKVSGHRRGSEHVMSVTWTLDDVKKAGLGNNQAYTKYPRQMLLARASAELVRQMCPDALGGIGLFAEEADDLEPAEPAAEPLIKATTRKRTTQPTPALTVAPEPPLPGDDEPDLPPAAAGPTGPQIKKMMATFNDLGIKAREDRLKFIAAAVRQVESSKELTVDEAGKVIDLLDAVNDGRAELVVVADTFTIIWPDLNQQPLLPDEEPF